MDEMTFEAHRISKEDDIAEKGRKEKQGDIILYAIFKEE